MTTAPSRESALATQALLSGTFKFQTPSSSWTHCAPPAPTQGSCPEPPTGTSPAGCCQSHHGMTWGQETIAACFRLSHRIWGCSWDALRWLCPCKEGAAAWQRGGRILSYRRIWATGEGFELKEKDLGYGRRIWATGEGYGLWEKDLGYRRRIWATGKRYRPWEKDVGYRRKMLGLQEGLGAAGGSWGNRRRELELQQYTGAMREGYWGYWETLGLWRFLRLQEKDGEAMGKVFKIQEKHAGAAGGFWSFRRTLELQKDLRVTGDGCWSCRRILGLQEEDPGAARRGSWGFRRRTLGLQEKDTGIQPCNQHKTPHTTNP